jgi:hypothetical protein
MLGLWLVLVFTGARQSSQVFNKWYQSKVRFRILAMLQSSAGGCSNRGESRHESPSPPPCRPRHQDGGCQVIVEWLVEKSTAGIVYPVLTHTNYTEWSVVMHVNLQAAGLWEAVWHGGDEYRDDRLARRHFSKPCRWRCKLVSPTKRRLMKLGSRFRGFTSAQTG